MKVEIPNANPSGSELTEANQELQQNKYACILIEKPQSLINTQ